MKNVWYVAHESRYTFHQSNVNRDPGTSVNRTPGIVFTGFSLPVGKLMLSVTGFSLPVGKLTLSALDCLHAGSSRIVTVVLRCSLEGSLGLSVWILG